MNDLLSQAVKPFHFVLPYKFSQDHLELFFNKVRRSGGWNNNPNVLQFKYAMRKILMRNSIQPSRTGNCTNFEEALSEPLFEFSWKKRNAQIDQPTPSPVVDEEEQSEDLLAIMLDQQHPNDMRDNILYYIAGFVIKAL